MTLPIAVPTIGRIVHYISEGSPVRPDGTQKFKSECRAAIITAVDSRMAARADGVVSLAILNPTGMFFTSGRSQSEADHRGGTWHWPERS